MRDHRELVGEGEGISLDEGAVPVPKRPGASAPTAHLLIASSERTRLEKSNGFRWQEGERCPYEVGMCVYTCVGVTAEHAPSRPPKPGVAGLLCHCGQRRAMPHQAAEQLPTNAAVPHHPHSHEQGPHPAL